MSEKEEVFEVAFTYNPTSDRWTAILPSGQRTSFPRTRGLLPPFLELAMNHWRLGAAEYGQYNPPGESSRERAVRLAKLGEGHESTTVSTVTPGLKERRPANLPLSLEDLEL